MDETAENTVIPLIGPATHLRDRLIARLDAKDDPERATYETLARFIDRWLGDYAYHQPVPEYWRRDRAAR